jgi:DNA-binding MarR family transcriptional regulator
VESEGVEAPESVEEEACVALLRTADRLEGDIAGWMKTYGVSPTQYNALRILRGAGEAGLPCSEVGARMINRDPDITRLVDRLAKRGLVTRGRDARDRRVIRPRITAAGLELLREMDALLAGFVRHRLGQLGAPRLHDLIGLLEAVVRAAEK